MKLGMTDFDVRSYLAPLQGGGSRASSSHDLPLHDLPPPGLVRNLRGNRAGKQTKTDKSDDLSKILSGLSRVVQAVTKGAAKGGGKAGKGDKHDKGGKSTSKGTGRMAGQNYKIQGVY